MTRKNIAVIGECMIELSQKGDALNRGFGGDTLNTSVYIARQVSPDALNVHYVTALGTDLLDGDNDRGTAVLPSYAAIGEAVTTLL